MISAISTAQLNSLGLNTPNAIASIPAQNLPKAFVSPLDKFKLFKLIKINFIY